MRGAPLHVFLRDLHTGIIPAYAGSTENQIVGFPILGGIIPAYAGSTRLSQEQQDEERDHPRVCGEHADTEGLSTLLPGSSPRMRGAHYTRNVHIKRYGIIPAYAGSTRANSTAMA